jgi:hypothetical protein
MTKSPCKRPGEFEQPLGLRRDAKGATGPRLARRETLEDPCPDRIWRDRERLKSAGGQLLRLREQTEQKVAGRHVVVPERACLASSVRERIARGRVEFGRPRATGSRGSADEPLLNRLFANAECLSDLRPTAAVRARDAYEIVDQLIRPFAHALSELGGDGQAVERRLPFCLDGPD